MIARQGSTSSREDGSLEDKNGSWRWCDLTKVAFDANMIRRIKFSTENCLHIVFFYLKRNRSEWTKKDQLDEEPNVCFRLNPRGRWKGVVLPPFVKVFFFFSGQPASESLEFKGKEVHFPFPLTCNHFSLSFLSIFVFLVIYVVYIVQWSEAYIL